MDKLPVGQLPDLASSNNDDEIMVITNSEYSQLKKEKISDLITDFTSTNENNALTKGTDGKMFVTDFGNASNITEGTLPTSVLPEIPLEKIPDIPKDKLPQIETDDLPDSGITAGTYTYPTDIVVNSKGQVTSITEGQAGANNANQDLSNLGPLGLDKINQSKALETGSVSSDADVYADIQKYAHSTFDKSKFEIVGSPNITNDGIASGLTASNYLTIPAINFASNWELKFSFILSSEVTASSNFRILGAAQGNPCLGINIGFARNKKLHTWISSGTTSSSSWDVADNDSSTLFQPNITYYITLQYKSGVYSLRSSTDNTTWETEWTKSTPTLVGTKYISIGAAPTENLGSNSSIDLKQFSITADGKEVFNGNKTGLDVIKPDNYTVVGSPVISDDGVASGFGTIGNILTVQNTGNLNINTAKSFRIVNKIYTKNAMTSWGYWMHFENKSHQNFSFGINKGIYELIWFDTVLNKQVFIKYSFTEEQVPDGTEIYSDVEYDGTTVKLLIYLNGKLISNKSLETTFEAINPTTLNIGNYNPTYNNLFQGSIDLNSIRIWVDGNLVYQPCLKIPYTESKTGSKIVDAAYRDRVQDMYEQYGYAPYYTIDEENQNFTLPMGEIYGMIERSKTVNPCTLLESKWTDYPIFSPSWLLASETYLSQGAYPDVYAALEIEYDTTKIVGASYQLPSGGYYIKRGVEVALATPPAPTVSATDGWTNPNNAFDDNAETYASCYTTTDYIELTYPAPVWVGGFTGTGNFVSGQAQATPLDMYIVDSDDIETLLCNGSSAAATASYTSTGTCKPVWGTKFRFKLQYVNSSNPAATYPTRYTNIEVTFANPDTAFILNQTEKTFRTPLTTRLASGKAVVGNGSALGLKTGIARSTGYLSMATNKTYGLMFDSLNNNLGAGVTTDPTKSGIETSDSDLYLYFYVGDVIKNVGEVNASELAGLLPMFEEVGGKLSLPDVHRYVDLTLGSSGSVYTSPADGWVGFSKISAGNNQYVALYAGTEASNSSETYYGYEMRGTGSGNYLTVMMPVQKGDQFYTTYSATGALFFFRFFYAVGDSTNVSNT